MRSEIQNLQKTLHSLVSAHEIHHSPNSGQILNQNVSSSGPLVSAQGIGKSPSLSAEQFSPATLSSRGKAPETHRMAMTRENSPESTGGTNPGATSVLVTEPMGGLYEVTRLRNIRSNQAKLDRSGPTEEEQMDDFIARGVGGICQLKCAQAVH